MPKKDTKTISVRIHVSLYEKLRYVAAYEGRSVNGQIAYAVRQYLQQFEQAHGEIQPTSPIDAE